MRVLVACEFSGVVRDAFSARGHDAWSCDLLPNERGGQHHQIDALDCARLCGPWDLMIAHPPCTYLANSGERWLFGSPERRRKRLEAVEFVRALWNAPVRRIAIENPVGHLSRAFQKPHQIIQPYLFGEPEWKTTCLWLKNLPPLYPTHFLEPDPTVGGGKKPGRVSSRIHRMAPGPERAKERSRTFPGIAKAMATQWGGDASLIAA